MENSNWIIRTRSADVLYWTLDQHMEKQSDNSDRPLLLCQFDRHQWIMASSCWVRQHLTKADRFPANKSHSSFLRLDRYLWDIPCMENAQEPDIADKDGSCSRRILRVDHRIRMPCTSSLSHLWCWLVHRRVPKNPWLTHHGKTTYFSTSDTASIASDDHYC